jgi:zinc/manganese transport system substrate-binding protein
MQHPHRMRTTFAVFAVVAVVLAGCADADRAADDDNALHVVATTSVWGEVVANVLGEDGSVEVLIPIGADAHAFQPSSRDVASLGDADLVVANGLGLEQGLVDVLDTAADDGARILELAPLLDPIPFGVASEGRCVPPSVEDPGHQSEEHGEFADGACDPHVWMDPLRVADAADLIATELSRIEPSIDWQGRASAYRQELLDADAAITTTLDAVPAVSRRMVTNHDAFGYFASRYDFTIAGVVIPGGSTLAEPSSADLADLVAIMRSDDATVIFAETSAPSVLAEAVASELGTEVRVVDLYTESLGGPGSGAETLIEMLTANATAIADGLSR